MKTRVIFSLFFVLFLSAACISAPVMPSAPAATAVSSASPVSESALPAQNAGALTARELTAPNALVGPSPSSFNWSPAGATLAYVEPQDGQDMLWLYDATSGDKKVLLDPAQSPGNIDVTSAQWSPSGDKMLLTGDEALWLLDVSTGELTSVVENAGSVTGQMFTPDGKRISYVQDNDLYVLTLADGKVQRLTTDGGETVFNGGLDWVYNEELATRAAQPAYAWSPDGVWLIYLRLDESAVHNDPITDYRPRAGDRQLHALSDSGHGKPNRHAPCAGPGRDRASRWRSRCPPAPNTCCRSSPGRRTPITRSSSP